MDQKRQKLNPGKQKIFQVCATDTSWAEDNLQNDVQKECQDAKIAALDRKLLFMKTDLEMVTGELEQVKEENSQLKSKICKHREQWTELLYENERLQKRLQDLESANINLEEKSRINLCNSYLTSQILKIEESNDEALGINALPNEMILKIFGYVEQNQLGQIARVCSRWNILTRSPALWKEVDLKFDCSHKSHNTMTRCFINMLPSCVTSIRLCYSNLDWTEELNFEEFCVRLQRRCPHLEVLILEHVNLSDNFPSVIGLCTQFLPRVKILVFRHSTFSQCPARGKFGGISKIEVLEVSDCNVGPYQELPFSNMPQLRVLNFGNSKIGSPVFQSLQNHGLNLEELYLCGAVVLEYDLIFSNSTFPRLKIMCLCCDFLIFNIVISAFSEIVPLVIQSCQSLQKVYIRESYLRLNVMSHPLFENRCKFNIIETVAEHHSHNIDYSYKKNKI